MPTGMFLLSQLYFISVQASLLLQKEYNRLQTNTYSSPADYLTCTLYQSYLENQDFLHHYYED